MTKVTEDLEQPLRHQQEEGINGSPNYVSCNVNQAIVAYPKH